MIRVSFNSGSGHEDLDEDPEPEIIEFRTVEEAEAFQLGVSRAAQALDGWVDGWAEAKISLDDYTVRHMVERFASRRAEDGGFPSISAISAYEKRLRKEHGLDEMVCPA